MSSGWKFGRLLIDLKHVCTQYIDMLISVSYNKHHIHRYICGINLNSSLLCYDDVDKSVGNKVFILSADNMFLNL